MGVPFFNTRHAFFFLFKQYCQSSRWICFLYTATISTGPRAAASKPVSDLARCSVVDMGTVVCLPTAENMGRFCGQAVDCFPSHFQHRAARSSPGEDLDSVTTQCEFLDKDCMQCTIELVKCSLFASCLSKSRAESQRTFPVTIVGQQASLSSVVSPKIVVGTPREVVRNGSEGRKDLYVVNQPLFYDRFYAFLL